MPRRSYLDLLRPGCPCPVLAAVPAFPQRLMTRRTYNQQYAGAVAQRASAPRALLPADNWWTGHPS
jgi:hypothetical protein